MYSFIMRMLLISRESTTLTKKLPKLFILSSYQKKSGYWKCNSAWCMRKCIWKWRIFPIFHCFVSVSKSRQNQKSFSLRFTSSLSFWQSTIEGAALIHQQLIKIIYLSQNWPFSYLLFFTNFLEVPEGLFLTTINSQK